MKSKTTIYAFASVQMQEIVKALLLLADETNNFTKPSVHVWADDTARQMLLCGKGYAVADLPGFASPQNAWLARLAVPFSIESAATGLLYQELEVFTNELIAGAYSETQDFTSIDASWIADNPQYLPVFMHVAGAFSKQDLKRKLAQCQTTLYRNLLPKRLASCCRVLV